ncbi:MAG: hypothetical protein LBL26_03025 [Peptococcaceae bacterium]|nr:hypothetical protein [Peptococcaceae bacterium]
MIGSIIMLFVFNARTSETAYASGETNNLAAFLTLPSEIPFRLMLPRNGGAGYVDSREFWITNNGEDVVALALDRVRVHIADGEFFALSYDESFPGDGTYL